MAKFIKVILLLLFAVALHGVANNFFAEKTVETQEHAQVYKVDSQQVSTAFKCITISPDCYLPYPTY